MTEPETDLPAPREGIAGTDRSSDPLLSLDEGAQPYRDALIAMAWHLRNATLVGSPAPKVQAMYERMRHPQPGDYVVESTWGWGRRAGADDRLKAFGILIAHRMEWASTWDEFVAEVGADLAFDDNRSRADAWYVQYGPDAADVCRWTNAEFVMVPVGRDAFKEAEPR